MDQGIKTCDEAAALLANDSEELKDIVVKQVNFDEATKTYYVKWMSKSDEETYKKLAADLKNLEAMKRAKASLPKMHVAAVFFNEDLLPSVQKLSREDLGSYAKSSSKMKVIDSAA